MSSVSALNSLLSSSSSSSIDLSSILQAATGSSSSGIDVTAAVNAAVAAARAPETGWQTEQTTLQSEASAMTTLQTQATSLDNDMQDLGSLAGSLSARTVSSSNSSLVSASASAGSAPGTHVVVVNSLATTASWTSGIFADGSSALPAGSFTITVGTGTPATITTDGTESISAVVSQINSKNLGVTARVVTDASGSRLALVSNTSGSAANFSISTAVAGYGFSQAATGGNALLTVDGISISSATNSVTGAVPGLTLNLLGAAPGVSVSLGVAPDTAQATSAINQFVADYNSLISSLNTQFTFNGSSEGALAGDSVVRDLQSQILTSLSYTYSPATGTTSVPNLSALGVSVNNDGTLSVNSTTLQNTLQGKFSDVQSFFQGTNMDGFANSLDQKLSNFTSPGVGAFTVDLKSINSQYNDLQNTIDSFETNYITPLKAQLKSEYSQAEILLQQLPTMMQQINTMLGLNNTKN